MLAVAVAVAALRPLRLDLGLINVVLVLLLISVVSAAAWGWISGLNTSVLSDFAFNFFFVPPLNRLFVQRPENALALALFLVVAGISASLLAQRRQSALEAEHQARDTQLLLALNHAALDQPLDRLPEAICGWIVRDFGLQACALYRLADGDLEPVWRRRARIKAN